MGYAPQSISPQNILEIPHKGELPKDFVQRMALEKCLSAREQHKDTIILSGDTIGACGRRIIQKASSEKHYREILKLLSGRRHRIYTAIALYDPRQEKVHQRLVPSIIKMKVLTSRDMDLAVSMEEWRNLAGYSIEGIAGSFIIDILGGTASAIQGLPMYETRCLLENAGIYPK